MRLEEGGLRGGGGGAPRGYVFGTARRARELFRLDSEGSIHPSTSGFIMCLRRGLLAMCTLSTSECTMSIRSFLYRGKELRMNRSVFPTWRIQCTDVAGGRSIALGVSTSGQGLFLRR